MRALKTSIFLMGILLLGACIPMSQPNRSTRDTKDRSAIAQALKRFIDTWNIHDARAFASTFAEDADFTNVAGTRLTGRSKVETFHARVFASIFKNSHQTAQIRSIRFLTPVLAAVDVDWQMTGATFRDGSPRPERKGLLNFVMAKQQNGSWQIEVMHNTDLTNAPPITK